MKDEVELHSRPGALGLLFHVLQQNRSRTPPGEKAGLDLAKELKEQGFFGDEEKVTVAIVSGRQPGLIGATDTIRVRVLE